LAGTGSNQGTEVDGINNYNQIVGVYTDSSGISHGFTAHIG